MFQKPKVKIYRDLVKFSNYALEKYWLHKLSLENFSTSANGLQNVLTICVSALDNFAPRKKKYPRENNMSFMNQILEKKNRSKELVWGILYLKNKYEENKIACNR